MARWVIRARVICGGRAMAETRILPLTPTNHALRKGLRLVELEFIENYSQIFAPQLDPPHKTAVESGQGKASRSWPLDFFGS